MSAAFSEIACSLVVSAYKGLTSTLEAVQQSYALRPFFNAKIIDDTIQPNQIISTNLPPLSNGSAVTAPDGTICAVGLDASDNVVLYKGANLHTGAWDSTKIIQAAGGDFDHPLNNFSIAVSDYIAGTYAILIVYHTNLTNTATPVTAQGWLSTNGGTTFTNVGAFSIGSNGSNYFGGNPLDLSISAMKPRLVNNVLKFGWFFIAPNTKAFVTPAQQGYDIKYAYGDVSAIVGPTTWGHRFINSQDWSIHSLTTYLLNGIDYVVFSGFRNFIDTPNLQIQGSNSLFIPQYGLWLTGIEQVTSANNDSDAAPTGDVWLLPQPVFNSIAIGNTNLNNFIFPVANVINGMVNLSFFAQIVDSVISQTLGSVNFHYSYMLIQSLDGEAFSYPAPYVMTDGAEFSGNENQTVGVSYTNQGNYRYLLGSGDVWEYIQNNIVADVTNDIVQYTIIETAGQPSSITLQLANQNNQWYPNGTSPGATAISGNRKVVFQQGYYNANGVPETVPRNIYFIDDINQNVSNVSNDVTISARDLYKKLKTLITKWAFNWFGPFFYVDSFDGTTLGNWSQQTSGWYETNNTLTTTSAPGADSDILLANIPRISEASVMAVGVLGKAVGNAYVYAYYFDVDNWLRLNYDFSTTPHVKIEKSVGGVVTSLATSNTSFIPNGETHMVWVRQYDYYKFSFYISAVATGNTLAAWASGSLIGSGEFDLSTEVIANQSQQWGVGVGANGVVPVFSDFQYSQFNVSNNVSEIIRRLATKAGVFVYNIQEDFVDYFFNPSDWYPGGDSSTFNRVLTVTGPTGASTNNYYKTTEVVADGEISFAAKCIKQTGNTINQFYFYFRVDSPTAPTAAYRLHVRSFGNATNVGFERLYAGTWYSFPACQSLLSGTALGGLNFDITQIHRYRVVFTAGWMYAFIDNIMVGAWNDNNSTSAYLTTGYIGFGAGQLSTLLVFGITSTAFWKQSPSFALNPGDDIESAVISATQSVRGWVFSDLFGALKAVLLNSNEASTYTYENQIFANGVDVSDKEYVSQVTVYGNGVSATARNTQLMAGVATRELVVVDYTILSQQDAQNRADYELTNSNQYRTQLNPKQSMNVGAEIFDPVTVVDTGNNSSGIDTITRVYAQKFTTGGSNNEYSLEIDTGTM